MDADPFFVERNPEHANRASRTRRQHVEIAHSVARASAFLRRSETSATWTFPGLS